MKNRTTAALLALFLGGLGLHKFYLGKWIQGLLYIAFCWSFIPAIFGLLEAIGFFMMSDEKFNIEHNGGGISMKDEIALPGTHVRCPDCRELVRNDARKCKHCGSALVPQE